MPNRPFIDLYDKSAIYRPSWPIAACTKVQKFQNTLSIWVFCRNPAINVAIDTKIPQFIPNKSINQGDC